ncbi:HAAS signaling domain-containing protein [Rheinheimera salexigens]|uniref:Uncharacterized protein n=1 Tax=Rheinheimera salexigens TaxID=1628148 RepID=A0A1E7Q2V3_9GAMM|nr:hypothetical protein [Rheinheimera salexigens]OEY68534.1 hypothetical protein BI198_02325 [Rheinheimera salexigens]
MELVKRYIAAVQRELPENKRDEIGRELNANIMDQLEALQEQQGTLNNSAIASVLKTLGHPRTVAQQFVPQQPLINAAYMPVFKNTLFMVLGILFVIQMFKMTTVWLSFDHIGLFGYLHGLASGFVEKACFAFTAITLSYWLISRQHSEKQIDRANDWQPENLPAVGASWQHISLQTIFTDLASYVFLLVIVWFPLFASVEKIASGNIILSTQALWILQLSSPVIIAGVLFSLWQLRQRLWSRPMLKANVCLNALLVAIALTLANISPILQLNTEQWQGIISVARLERSAMITLLIIALFPAWEVLRDLYRLRKTT